MQKAWKIVGVSTVKPESLPKGFTVVEKEIGCVHQIPLESGRHINFVENKAGDIVVYREGVSNSNFRIPREEFADLMTFMRHVYAEHCTHGEKVLSKCPGTPHRGHTSPYWICGLDQA